MRTYDRIAGRRQEAVWLIALFAGLALAVALPFYIFGPKSEGIDPYVAAPGEWEPIDLSEADLTLPLVSPFKIANLDRRAGDDRMREEIYTFHGIKGYVKTSRMTAGTFPEPFAKSLGSAADFRAFVAELRLPPGGKVSTGFLEPVSSGQFYAQRALSRGFATRPTSRLSPGENCFVARAAYLLVDVEAIKHSPEAIDTVVEVLLCGDLLPRRNLAYMLARVRKVENRDTFRQELAQR